MDRDSFIILRLIAIAGRPFVVGIAALEEPLLDKTATRGMAIKSKLG
jgi:hypothetical protein